MIYLMNSAVFPAGCFGTYEYSRANLDDLKAVVGGERGDFVSCIGYPQNVELIKRWTGYSVALNRIETIFEEGDCAFVMRLKKRIMDPNTKGAPVGERPEDWEFAWVDFSGDTRYIPGRY